MGFRGRRAALGPGLLVVPVLDVGGRGTGGGPDEAGVLVSALIWIVEGVLLIVMTERIGTGLAAPWERVEGTAGVADAESELGADSP
jgi:hypothetical protein